MKFMKKKEPKKGNGYPYLPHTTTLTLTTKATLIKFGPTLNRLSGSINALSLQPYL
jgi:hypothetical protein